MAVRSVAIQGAGFPLMMTDDVCGKTSA